MANVVSRALSQTVKKPERFDPDRFIDEAKSPQSPYDYVFGFGRRLVELYSYIPPFSPR